MPRRTLPFALLAAGSLILALGGPASAQPAADRVDVVQIDGVLDQHVAGYLRDVIERAGAEGSALVAIQLDTGGGLNVDPEELVAPIRDSDVPVLTFIGDSGARALGAGVFVAQASDHLMLSPVTQMGAAAPADLRDGPPDAAARSEAAALLRDLAAEQGRDADFAAATAEGEVAVLLAAGATEADVDPAAVAGSSARYLTSEQALDGGIADAVVPDLFAAIDAAGFRASQDALRFNNLGLPAEILSTVASPGLAYLLLMAGVLSLAFEAFQPGFGVAGVSGVLLLGLGLYGLAVLPISWVGLALLAAGTLLLAADLSIAGLGIPTAAGAAATLAGSLLLFPGPDPLRLPVWVAVTVSLFSVVFFVFIMTWVLRAQGSAVPATAENLVGRPGVVRSVLNPEGHVFVDGTLWRARLRDGGGKVRTGTPVRVTGLDQDATLEVELLPETSPAGT
jgi:membrane-bound serine protease (ClpP class)